MMYYHTMFWTGLGQTDRQTDRQTCRQVIPVYYVPPVPLNFAVGGIKM